MVTMIDRIYIFFLQEVVFSYTIQPKKALFCIKTSSYSVDSFFGFFFKSINPG